MEKSNVRLFDTPDDQFIMPGSNPEDLAKQEALTKSEIDNAIFGRKIKTVVLPEEAQIELPNYVIDLTDLGEITIFQKAALQNLLTTGGDTAIYFYLGKRFTRVGYGMSHRLENLLSLTKKHIFSDKISIYRNLERDKPVDEVVTRDVTKLRLNL
jgi:hypothetical protein